jgi:hypothetical protein
MARTVDKTAAKSNGLNVEPLGSTLQIWTLSADCSGLTVPPVDGEFIMFAGDGEAVTAVDNSDFDAVGDKGSQLRMVWGHKDRSDIQATGRKKTPVIFKGGMHMKLSLYDFLVTQTLTAGTLVYVQRSTDAVLGGTAVRGVATISTAAPTDGWVVGHVVASNASTLVAAADGDAIPAEIYLYDTPMWIKA